MSTSLETQFAPPERTPREILLAQINALKEHDELTRVLDAIPEYVMVLNNEREIVFANKSLLEYLELDDEFLSKGFRPEKRSIADTPSKTRPVAGQLSSVKPVVLLSRS